MSLDVYLKKRRWTSYDCGKTYEEDNEAIYNANITHNLTSMAEAAGLYEALWRPYKLKSGNCVFKDYAAELEFEDNNIIYAKDIVNILEAGLNKLENNPERYKKFNPSNGWGKYDTLVRFVKEYIDACKMYPDAIICVSR